MTDSIRLAKRVAELRACSRREAEQTIAGGWVRVDGVVIEEPQFRVADQRIEIDPLADPAQTLAVTLLLHKPPGYRTGPGDDADDKAASLPHAHQLLGAAARWAEDASGIHPLKKHFTRLTLCVPLETGASGLVVFTQDWRVARKLTEDAATLEHEVIVEVAGDLIPHGLKRLNQGISFHPQGVGRGCPREGEAAVVKPTSRQQPRSNDAKASTTTLQGRMPSAIKVSWQNENRLRVALKGAQIGQIAHLCEAVGLRVVSMKRIRLGRVPLAQLPPGQWRYLCPGERF